MKKQIVVVSMIVLASILLTLYFQPAPADARLSTLYPFIEEIPMNIRYGGRATAVSVNPANPNIALVASESGGLFRTDNGGVDWNHVDALPLIHLNDVDYAPWPNSNVIIAAGWLDGHLPDDQGGIWRSDDGGTIWKKPSLPTSGCRPMINAWSVAFGGDTGLVYAVTSCGLSISEDLGETWPISYTVPEIAMLFSVAADTNNFYVCNHLGLARGVGVALGGVVSLEHRCMLARHNLALSPLESQVVYLVDDAGSLPAACPNDGKHAGRALYEGVYNPSTNLVTWSQVYNTCFRIGGRAPWVAANLSRDGKDDHYDVYFGNGLKTFRNTCISGGSGMRCPATSWQQVLEDHDDQSGIAFDAETNCARYMVSDGGVHTAVDAENYDTCGSQWRITGTPKNGYNALQVYDLAGTNMNDGILYPHTDLYAGTQDNGFWASEDGGASWPYGCGNEGYNIEVPITGTNHTSQSIELLFHDAGAKANVESLAHFQGPAGRECFPLPVENPPGRVFDSPLRMSENRYLQYSEPVTGTGTFQLNLGLSTPVPTGYGFMWDWDPVNQTRYSLEDRGQVSTNGGHITYYRPYRQPARLTSHGDQSFGLMKVTGIHPDGTLDPDPPTTLANGSGRGRLGAITNYPPGQGAWRWSSVYAVDPRNPDHLIAADVVSDTMKVSLNGGITWTTDAPLTALTTNNGEYRFFIHGDQQPFPSEGSAMQPHVIGFDPFIRNHILVGTHQLGVIQSIDGGETWEVIPDTQKITNITDFFFMKNPANVYNVGTFWVSTYGRGIWKITDSIPSLLYRFNLAIADKWTSRIIDPLDGDFIDPYVIYDPLVCPQCQFLTAPRGEIWGFDASGGQVNTVYLNQSIGGHLIGSNNVGEPINSTIPTMLTDTFGPFDDCKICDDVYNLHGNKIRGLVLNKDVWSNQPSSPNTSELMGIIISIGEEELPGADQIQTFDAFPPESPSGPEAPEITDPYIKLEGTYPIGGEATIGDGDTLTALGSGFSEYAGECGYVHISIDDEEHSGISPYPDGTFTWQYPINVSTFGHHVFKAEQQCGSNTLMDWTRFMVVIEEEWWDYRTIYLPVVLNKQK